MKTKNNLLLATTALVTLTALTFSGCSENEVTDINPDANPAMSFDVYTGVQTKGTETTTSSIQTTTTDGFGVLAYQTTDVWSGEGIVEKATPNIMYNEHVYHDGTWKYDNTKFWPIDGSKITFFAYAPYESAPSAGTSKKIKLSAATETGAPTIEFEVNTELTNMVDLVTDNTQKDKTSSDNTGTVNFEFQHVLTKVVLKAKTDVELGNDTKVFITGVKVVPQSKKLCSKATYKFADDTWDYTESTPTYFESDINLYDETNGVLNLTKISDSWGYTETAINVSGETGVDLFKTGEALYFIPARNTDGLETAGDVQLKVSYDIVTKISDEKCTKSSTADKVIDLPAESLKKGNFYTYTLKISMNAIKLEGTVSDWTNATSNPGSGDINVK